MPPKHFIDCTFCNSSRYAEASGWRCSSCMALWTLSGRLIFEGNSSCVAITEDEPRDPLIVDVEYLYYPHGFAGPITPCQLKIYRHNHQQIIVITDGGKIFGCMYHTLNLINRDYGINERSIIIIECEGDYTQVEISWHDDEIDVIDFSEKALEYVERITGIN